LETETCETQTQLAANRLLELPPRKGIAEQSRHGRPSAPACSIYD